MTQLSSITGATGAYSLVTLSAPFSDITDAPLGGATAGNTVTLTMGSGQTITYDTGGIAGTVRCKLNAGAFTVVSTLVVANGDTLQHNYQSVGAETGTVIMRVGSTIVGSFNITGT